MTNLSLEIKSLSEALCAGKSILYPTDTVWGLGADATNLAAIEKIYQIKERPLHKNFIILFKDIEMLKEYGNITEFQINTIQNECSEKPTTIILEIDFNLPNILKSDEGLIAFRIPDNAFCQALLAEFKKPIVSTSANLSNMPTPIYFEDIDNQIKEKADIIANPFFDSGNHKPSQILKIAKNSKTWIRK
jgi:L-threonylcarbamoyladenylate synthase